MDYKKTASHKQMLKNNALMMKMDLDRRNSIKNNLRSRPREHSRSGSVTSKVIVLQLLLMLDLH